MIDSSGVSNRQGSFKLQEVLEQRRGDSAKLHARFMNPQMPRMLSMLSLALEYESGRGAYLKGVDGREILDFVSGFGVFGLGRNHPAIREAIESALDLSLPNLVQLDTPLLSGLLAEALVNKVGAEGYRCYFSNSGAEVVETAIKFCRAATKRPEMVFADHAFHGLTLGALSLNGGGEFRKGFGELLAGCRSVPFGDADALEAVLRTRKVAGFVVEPVQGKGIRVADPDYLRAVRGLCSQYGTLLVLDEVQTGLGRTGRCFGFEESGILPDVITVAKTLSGGFVPVGAVIASDSVFRGVYSTIDRAMAHSSTFGQNALAMVAGLATLKTIESEGIVENAATVGADLISKLTELASRYDLVGEVRGRGLIVGVQFRRPTGRHMRMQWRVLELMRKGLFAQLVVVPLFRDHGILTQVGGDFTNVLKILPPLIIGREEVDRFVGSLDSVLDRLHHSLGIMYGVGGSLAAPAIRGWR